MFQGKSDVKRGAWIQRCATALVCAMLAGPASAAIDLESDEARFEWTPASGPVEGYAVYLSRNGGPMSLLMLTAADETWAVVPGVPGDELRLQVAAFSAKQPFGPPSDPSEQVRLVEAPEEPADGLFGVQQRPRGEGPQAADVFGLNDLQLAFVEALAVGDLVVGRIAVLRRAAFEHVQNEDVFALQSTGFDDLVQQLTSSAYEGLALPVLIGPRSLAEEADARLGIPDAEDRLGARGGQLLAKRTSGDFLPE